MKPLTSERNLTPSSTAWASPLSSSRGVTLPQLLQGQTRGSTVIERDSWSCSADLSFELEASGHVADHGMTKIAASGH